MDIMKVVLLIVAFVASAVIGYFLGKNSLKPQGAIVFETYIDDETKEECVRCTFKLDMDVDEIVKENYILFGVNKDKAVMDYYKKEKST